MYQYFKGIEDCSARLKNLEKKGKGYSVFIEFDDKNQTKMWVNASKELEVVFKTTNKQATITNLFYTKFKCYYNIPRNSKFGRLMSKYIGTEKCIFEGSIPLRQDWYNLCTKTKVYLMDIKVYDGEFFVLVEFYEPLRKVGSVYLDRNSLEAMLTGMSKPCLLVKDCEDKLKRYILYGILSDSLIMKYIRKGKVISA